MKAWRKKLVYRSKDREDWDRAKGLLEEAGIEHFPFASEELPAGGCGAKIDPRKFLNAKPVPTTIYRIEVAAADGERAEAVLRDKVKPVISYGVGL